MRYARWHGPHASPRGPDKKFPCITRTRSLSRKTNSLICCLGREGAQCAQEWAIRVVDKQVLSQVISELELGFPYQTHRRRASPGRPNPCSGSLIPWGRRARCVFAMFFQQTGRQEQLLTDVTVLWLAALQLLVRLSLLLRAQTALSDPLVSASPDAKFAPGTFACLC